MKEGWEVESSLSGAEVRMLVLGRAIDEKIFIDGKRIEIRPVKMEYTRERKVQVTFLITELDLNGWVWQAQTLSQGETFSIRNDIELMLLDVQPIPPTMLPIQVAVIGVTAPKEVLIVREEL